MRDFPADRHLQEGTSGGTQHRVSDEIVDLVYSEAAKKNGHGKPQMDAWSVRVACEALATTNRVVIAGEVRVPDTLLKKDKVGNMTVPNILISISSISSSLSLRLL